jgi:hypothetical protein
MSDALEPFISRMSPAERELLTNGRLTERWSNVPRVQDAPNAMRGWGMPRGILETRSGQHSYEVRLSPFGMALRDRLARDKPGV